MRFLWWRNIKLYFANTVSVIMSCLGALIAFFIFIGFLQRNLAATWSGTPSIIAILDLWMMAGIITVAGITTSFQVLGQLVRDRASQAAIDLWLTDITRIRTYGAYILAATAISFVMQVVTGLVMGMYFTIVDKVTIPSSAYLPAVGYLLLGAVAATLVNALIILPIRSEVTCSRIEAIIGAGAGFIVATYMPLGALSSHIQALVKIFPSSYEAAALRGLFLQATFDAHLSSAVRNHLQTYLGVHFAIHGYDLSGIRLAITMVGMIGVAVILVVVSSYIIGKRDLRR